MRVKVVDWNVNGFATTGQPGLLSLEWDIACLQEVTQDSWPLFRALADHDGLRAFGGTVVRTRLRPLPGVRSRR